MPSIKSGHGRTPAVVPGFDRLGTETAFGVLARAKALEQRGRSIIHLEIGEPDFPAADHVAEAAFVAIRAGDTRYCPSAGIGELRSAAAAHLSATRRVAVSPDNVVIGSGAKLLLFFTVLATCGPGDEVVYPTPGFPIYESAIRWAGATPVPLCLRREADFTFGGEDLAALLSCRTKLVILNSPHNPTGSLLSPAQLSSIADAVQPTCAWILSDEVYSRIVYEEPFASIASVAGMLDRTVVLESMSKTYAMTGWRCGYAAVPGPLVEPMTRLVVNSTSCVPPFVQRAAIAALTGAQDSVRAMVEEFRRRRDMMVEQLNRIPGVTCPMPAGAFYAYPQVDTTLAANSDELATRLLTEGGVAALSGAAFGDGQRGHLRFSYAASRTELETGLGRFEQLLGRATEHSPSRAGPQP